MRETKVKYTLQKVKEIFLEKGFDLVTEEYLGVKQKFILKDSEGYSYIITLDKFSLGHMPDRFSKSNTFTLGNIKLWCVINKKLFKLTSEKYEGSNKYLQWKCLIKGCEETFPSTWSDIFQGVGCGYCNGKRVGLSNCLATKNPKLASEWHPTKNSSLTPYNVTPRSHKDIWWICNNGHEWENSPDHRSGKNGTECPYCSGFYPSKDYNLLVINPELCKEWNYNKNSKHPEEYTPNSNKKVWWKCKNNLKHEWITSINNRNTRGDGCPYCAKRHLPSDDYNLLISNPKLCEEWDYAKNNKKPEDYTPVSGVNVWWKCRDCSHEWEATIANRNKNNDRRTRCPSCFRSKGEMAVQEWLNKYNFYFSSEYDKFYSLVSNLGNPLRFDFAVFYDINKTNIKLLIEFDGKQHFEIVKGWQTEESFETLQYHDKLKDKYCKDNNIKLLRIRYDEFDDINNILLKELLHK